MTCRQCGALVPVDAGYCRACGTILRGKGAPSGAVSSVPPLLLGTPPSAHPGPAGPAWPAAPAAGAAERAWPAPGQVRPQRAASGVGDAIAFVATAVVLASLFLSWYSVTVTAAGLQYLTRLERALFPQLFAAGLFPAGPVTARFSPLDHDAGGWRWAILVVAIAIVLEMTVTIGSGMSKQQAPGWPHASVLLVLTATNLVLVAAAFFSRPLSSVPAMYASVSDAPSAYVGLLAGTVALCGAVACVFAKSPKGDTAGRPHGLRTYQH